jgi:hypothetical protein
MEQCASSEREGERERAKCAVSRVGVLKVERDKISSYNLQVERKGGGGGERKLGFLRPTTLQET